MTEDEAAENICFVICPIGTEESPTRDRSNKVFTHIISPVVKELGYEPMRSDHDSRPGRIGNQIIRHLVDDPLVIADLTDQNPNVFYELAIRHMVAKPFIHIMQSGQKPPFDVSDNRTIFVDHTDLNSVAHCKEHLKKQIQEVEKDSTLVDNPISVAIERRALEQSKDPTDKSIAEILTRLDQLSRQVNRIAIGQQSQRPQKIKPASQTSWSEFVSLNSSSEPDFNPVLLETLAKMYLDGPLAPDEYVRAQDVQVAEGDAGLARYFEALASRRNGRKG